MNKKYLKIYMNLALLTALSLAISLIESMVPMPVPIPGARLGFSNIIILIAIYFYDYKKALTVSILKSFLLVLITGSVMSFFYSIVGAIFSTSAMYFAIKKLDDDFSLIGVSEIGAFSHNLGQIIVAIFFMQNIKMFYYFPILVFIGIFTGFFVGLSTDFMIKHLEKIGVFNE
ncbi:Gx transporter family protein [Anaerococcus hydrogenalis]|uniref:Heptaprenyl diphosphate synthase n=1 Tax=Anaerococcus hydrogenalis TaxID=33029 RepID=A0A2N6UKL8_9FIRM|nr:Gx transporter family protein [Anaerococcus hydrogenalis]MBS5988855.1 Gx transporter family protein [Anaerococcus hydrogenalis]MDK7694289.1 Gx transporter family protein [Anaerococcus hydrogenalis]MDK7696067.1 Gx transporter family protein [Anaerococcus hydrogenalis]MDK7707316.1 Gx transporter family protein [Anaerococcus hydrogenalis]PMC82339.1 heptaprenyl diphosphate synthase [Anaerococcus hydrogenalis]